VGQNSTTDTIGNAYPVSQTKWLWYFNPSSFGFAEFAPWAISDVFDGCGVFKEFKLSANSSTAPLLKHPVPEGDNTFSVTTSVEYTGTRRGWY
jgi:hypothetical protein